jgi:hypothetical protein
MREHLCLLILELVLKECSEPVGGTTGPCLASSHHRRFDPICGRRSVAEADPIEPGVVGKVLAAVVETAGVEEQPIRRGAP